MTPEEVARRIRELRRAYDSVLLGLVGLERYCDFHAEHGLPLPDDWVERIGEVAADLGGMMAALSRLALEHGDGEAR